MHKFNFKELLISSKLSELGQIFGQQPQQLNNAHSDESLFRITRLRLWESCHEGDPMPILEKIPTLMVLDLTSAYVGSPIFNYLTIWIQLLVFQNSPILSCVLCILRDLEWKVEGGERRHAYSLKVEDY